MAEKTIPTKEQVLNTPQRKIVFECLKRGLSQKQAAKEANLSYGYVRYWITKDNIKDLVLQETAVETQDLRTEAIAALTKIMRDPDSTKQMIIKAIDTLGKMNGWHSNTLTLETPARQRELDEAQRIEAGRLADLRYGMLTDRDAAIIDSRDVTIIETMPVGDGPEEYEPCEDAESSTGEDPIAPQEDGRREYPSIL